MNNLTKGKILGIKIASVLLIPILLAIVYKIYTAIIKFIVGCSEYCIGSELISFFVTGATVLVVVYLIATHFDE